MSAKELADSLNLPRRLRRLESNVRWPIVWTSNCRALLYIPLLDGADLQMETPTNPPMTSRSIALQYVGDEWDKFLHFGHVPQEPARRLLVGAGTNEACSVVSSILSGKVDLSQFIGSRMPLGPAVALAAEASPIVRWIVDSGCGHDLVSRKNLIGFEHLFRRAPRPQALQTANGITQAELEIPIVNPSFGR